MLGLVLVLRLGLEEHFKSANVTLVTSGDFRRVLMKLLCSLMIRFLYRKISIQEIRLNNLGIEHR